MTGDRPTLTEVAAEVEDRATSVVVTQVLPGGGTEYRDRLALAEMRDEADLLHRYGPGSFRLRFLDERGKFVHSAEARIAGDPRAPVVAAPVAVPASGELAELRQAVRELTALVRSGAGAAAPAAAPAFGPMAAGDFAGVQGMGAVLALAQAMAAPSHKMTEALLPLFLQTIKPPDKDAGTAATDTLLKGIDLGMAMVGQGPAKLEAAESSYADVIRDVGLPLVQMLQRRVDGVAPAANPPEVVDPIVAELATHARTVAARCAGLGPAEAAELVNRVASATVDGEVPGHPGLSWRELLTDAEVRAAVGRVVPDVAARPGWWEAFALDLWDLGAPEEPETGGGDGHETGETDRASVEA